LEVNRNALAVESQRRKNALKEAAEKEAEITKKLGESNKSIQNLTTQRDELLKKGELNAAEKENLERIRNELTKERNAKKNEINRLQTLSKNRERALKETSAKLNVATRKLKVATKELNTSERLVGIQEVHLKDQNVKLEKRQKQVGDLYREIEALKTQATQANEEIKQQTTKLATSANEINRLQGQLTNATEARARNIRNMQMRHAENIRAATDQIQALTKNVQERNAIIQRSKVAGRWKGLALGAQLRNTRTNLTKAQKEIGNARNELQSVLRTSNLQRAQIEGQQSTIGALRARNNVSRKVITGLQGQRKNLQKSKAASAWKGATRALRANTRLRNAKGGAMRLGTQLRNAKGEAMRLGTQLKEKNEQIKFEQNWIGKAEKRALNAREAVRVSEANRMKERIAAQREIKGLRTTLENRDRKSREQFNATKAFYQLNNLNAAKRNLTNEIGKNLPRYFLNGLERIRLENRVKAAENMRNIGRIRNDLKRTVGMRMKKAGKQGTFGRGFAGSDHSAGRNYALHTRSRTA
jgi:chromosome segregation ATPase